MLGWILMPQFRFAYTGLTTIRNAPMPSYRFFEGGSLVALQEPPAKEQLVPTGPAIIDASGNRLVKFAVPFAKDFDPEAFVAPAKVHAAIYPPGTVIDSNDPLKTLNEAPANGFTAFPEPGAFDADILVTVSVNTTALFKREASLEVPYAIILEYAE